MRKQSKAKQNDKINKHNIFFTHSKNSSAKKIICIAIDESIDDIQQCTGNEKTTRRTDQHVIGKAESADKQQEQTELL